MRSEIFGVTISAINETLPSISLFKERDCFAIARNDRGFNCSCEEKNNATICFREINYCDEKVFL